MKTRIIQTRFWDDNYVLTAPKEARYLYIHLLTCSKINICGVFQYATPLILASTGMNFDEFQIGEAHLSEHNKVHFLDGWIYVVNSRKNNNYERTNFNVEAADKEIQKIPQRIKDRLELLSDSSIYSSMDSNKKQKTINNKQQIENNNTSNNIYSSKPLNEIDEVDFI